MGICCPRGHRIGIGVFAFSTGSKVAGTICVLTIDYEWDRPQYDDGSLERYVRRLTGTHLLFDPGARFSYSNIAYEVLGDAIAKVSGETFESYVRRHIPDPLGMSDSTLLYRDTKPQLMSDGHVLDSKGNPEISDTYPYNRTHSPSSGLHSNVLNIPRWAIANMNRGELDGKSILQASTYDLIWAPSSKVSSLTAISTRTSGDRLESEQG